MKKNNIQMDFQGIEWDGVNWIFWLRMGTGGRRFGSF